GSVWASGSIQLTTDTDSSLTLGMTTRSECLGATEVSDLPLVEMPPAHSGATLAVLVTGDGGWRAIDRLVANGLHDRGFGIVGLISSRYFATRRTAEESSCALQRIIEHYSIVWHSRR